jgi:phosphatidylglycerol---prolipoprotein diacylglyceryl transferase
MLPILQIGPLALPAPALILLIGFWIGLDLAEKQAAYFDADSGPIYNLALVAAIAGLLGARIVYAAQAPAPFLENPLNLLTPRPQMLDANGGVIIGLLAALVYGWLRKLRLWPTLDAATSLFATLTVTLGLAHFAYGDAFGAPAHLPWAIQLWGEQRHPSQVYETLATMLVAAAIWPGRPVARFSRQRPGFRFWVFLALSAAARLFLETFRGDSTLVWNAFRQAQLIAWPVLAVSLWQIGRRLEPTYQPESAPLQPEAAPLTSEAAPLSDEKAP